MSRTEPDTNMIISRAAQMENEVYMRVGILLKDKML